MYRYIREAVEVPSTRAPTLTEAMATIRRKAFVILDGTLLPIDRIAADTPYYPGKHKRHDQGPAQPRYIQPPAVQPAIQSTMTTPVLRSQ